MNRTAVLIDVKNRKPKMPLLIDNHIARIKLAAIDHIAAVVNLRCNEGVRKSRYGLGFGFGCALAIVEKGGSRWPRLTFRRLGYSYLIVGACVW